MPRSKVIYRPIEAAIRWSGLIQHEREILSHLANRRIPGSEDFPRWPQLRLNTERIYDAIINRELPFGLNGVTVHPSTLVDINHPELTIRHVDLKKWMAQYYPDHKPPFLFDGLERRLRSGISFDAVQALVLERDALMSKVAERCAAGPSVRRDPSSSSSSQQNPSSEAGTADENVTSSDPELSTRSETTYLHIIGGLLTLLLGHTPSGQRYSSFNNQEAIISTMLAHHGGRLGITERTLAGKFAAAKRALSKE